MTKPVVTLITPVTDRPEAWALCEKYMAQQTVWKEYTIQWIVVGDDEYKPVKCTLGQEYYFGGLQYKAGINTQRYNLDTALSKVKGDRIFFVEEDDYYSSTYLEVYLDLLKHAQVVGESNVVYYNVKNRFYRNQQNFHHASLSQTAFRKELLPLMYQTIHSGEMYMDIALWRERRRATSILFEGLTLGVGIKGMPGRKGIGFGHTMSDNDGVSVDKDFILLPQLLKSREAAEVYRGFYRE